MLVLWAMVSCSLQAAMPGRTDPDALLESVRPALVEVEVRLSQVEGSASMASGFLVERPDWLATNLHAIEWAVMHGQRFHAVVHGAQGQRLSAQVLAIDPINDLALLQTPVPLRGTPFRLREGLPKPQETLTALGSPGDEGFVTEPGRFDGLADSPTVRLMRFLGDVRSGMSGGPVLDEMGQVAGVVRSVDTRRDGLGYLVPSVALQALLDQAKTKPYRDAASLKADLMRRYQRFFGQVVDQLVSHTVQPVRLGRMALAGHHEGCTPTRFDLPTESFEVYRLTCSTWMAANFLDDHELGDVRIRHYWITRENLGTRRAAKAVTYLINYLRDEPLPKIRLQGEWQCHYQRLTNAQGITLDLEACRRPYQMLEGFHDYRLRAAVAVTMGEGLVTALDMTGMDEANAQRLARHWLDRVGQPGERRGSPR